MSNEYKEYGIYDKLVGDIKLPIVNASSHKMGTLMPMSYTDSPLSSSIMLFLSLSSLASEFNGLSLEG